MTTPERRHQQRRRADIHPMEALNIAGRHLLDAGGSDLQFIDGQVVILTAHIATEEEQQALFERAKRERQSCPQQKHTS